MHISFTLEDLIVITFSIFPYRMEEINERSKENRNLDNKIDNLDDLRNNDSPSSVVVEVIDGDT